MSTDPKNWKRFYGVGTLADAQKKYIHEYSHLDTKDPTRVAASAALLYALAQYTNDIKYGLPMPFVEGLRWTTAHANTRENRQALIEGHMQKAKNRSKGAYRKPSLFTKLRVKAAGLRDPRTSRAQTDLYLLSHLDMKNARRVKASSAFLRIVAQEYLRKPESLPANFVFGLSSLLQGSKNRLSKPELRARVEAASKSYYNYKNSRTAGINKAMRAAGPSIRGNQKVHDWIAHPNHNTRARVTGQVNVAHGNLGRTRSALSKATTHHSALSNLTNASSYRPATVATVHRAPSSVHRSVHRAPSSVSSYHSALSKPSSSASGSFKSALSRLSGALSRRGSR
jgi:hypothetical protein